MPVPVAALPRVITDVPLEQILAGAADAVPVAGVPEQLLTVIVPFNVKSSSLPVPLDPCDPPLHTRCMFTEPVRLLTAVRAAPVIFIVPVLAPLATLPVPITVPFASNVQVVYPVPL